MANAVYETREIKLQDDTEVTLVPLTIGPLRRFMKAWGEFANITEEDAAFDIYVNCCGIALEKQLKDKFEKTRDAEKYVTDEYREYLEDVLDMDTIYEILDVCGGLKLNSPQIQEEVERLMREQEDGTK